MSFQWLQMRITEETERREREAKILDRLPSALDDLRATLASCIETYTAAFGAEAADLSLIGLKLQVIVREPTELGWKECGRVEIDAVPSLPGFEVHNGGSTLAIEIGMLPGDRIYYRDREIDQYLTPEELTRRVLDRALFPKLKD